MSDRTRFAELEEALRTIERLRSTMEAVEHQLRYGEASDEEAGADRDRDVRWCADQLRDALVTPAPVLSTLPAAVLEAMSSTERAAYLAHGTRPDWARPDWVRSGEEDDGEVELGGAPAPVIP